MIKLFFVIFISALLISGCSEEDKNYSDDIKIEQQNPSSNEISETSNSTSQDGLKTDSNTEEKIQQDKQAPQQTQKQEAVSLKSKQTSKYIGKNAIVTGYIADVFKNEKVAYLNFDAKFPKNSCAAVIFKDDFGKFGNLSRFKNKNVQIEGIISEYSGKPQIILKNTSQVKIID